MITRRSLFGLTFGGAVAASTAKLTPAEHRPDPFHSEQVQPSAPPMRITIGRTGMTCKVEIAGVDVTRHCAAAVITAAAGDVSRIHLEMFVPEGSEIVADAGVLNLELRDARSRLRFAAEKVRTTADL